MMQQYQELKRRYPDHLLFFRLGDFYETFFEDAELAARLLQITLTARQGAPMAGIPHHAADAYIARLVRVGQKIAVCEQLEAPGRQKKLLRRGVVRVITPGTLTDTAYLEGAANNFLLALGPARDATGVALVDVSTGEFWVGEDGPSETEILSAALLRRPSEILVPDSLRANPAAMARLQATGAALTFCDPATFAPRRAAADLCAHFRVESLDPFGVGDLGAGLGAASAALAYRRAGRGARRADAPAHAPARRRRPRTAGQPRDPRGRPRARPRRSARVPVAARPDPPCRRSVRRGVDRRSARRTGAPGRAARVPGGGARGRAAADPPRRRRDPRELARGALGPRARCP